MDNLPVYLLKVSIGTGLLYLCFTLFFKNDTFYLRNRILLISTLLLPFIIPLIKISNYSVGGAIAVSKNTITGIIISGTALNTTISAKLTYIDYNNIFIWIYFSFTAFILLKAFLSVTRTFILIRKGTILNSNFPKIIISNQQHPPFSFFPYVVIPKNIYDSGKYNEILEHENTHVRQGHTFDLLLNELTIAFQWFNPFIWLIKRSIILNHEFLADKASLKKAKSVKDYQYSLLNVLTDSRSIPLTHNFANLIKIRVVMINKEPSSRYAILKNLVILPVVIVLLIIFSFKGNPVLKDKSNLQSIFSKESQTILRTSISTNTFYPDEAIRSGISGRFTILVKMAKGGKEEKITIIDNDKKITVPYITNDCINIVRLARPESLQNKTGSNVKKTDLTILKNEGVRVAKSLESLKLPEWQEHNVEFAIDLNFSIIPVIIFVDEKEIKYTGLDKIDHNYIYRMSIPNAAYSTSKYGERGKNGVFEVFMSSKKVNKPIICPF